MRFISLATTFLLALGALALMASFAPPFSDCSSTGWIEVNDGTPTYFLECTGGCASADCEFVEDAFTEGVIWCGCDEMFPRAAIWL